MEHFCFGQLQKLIPVRLGSTLKKKTFCLHFHTSILEGKAGGYRSGALQDPTLRVWSLSCRQILDQGWMTNPLALIQNPID